MSLAVAPNITFEAHGTRDWPRQSRLAARELIESYFQVAEAEVTAVTGVEPTVDTIGVVSYKLHAHDELRYYGSSGSAEKLKLYYTPAEVKRKRFDNYGKHKRTRRPLLMAILAHESAHSRRFAVYDKSLERKNERYMLLRETVEEGIAYEVEREVCERLGLEQSPNNGRALSPEQALSSLMGYFDELGAKFDQGGLLEHELDVEVLNLVSSNANAYASIAGKALIRQLRAKKYSYQEIFAMDSKTVLDTVGCAWPEMLCISDEEVEGMYED